MLYVVCIWNCEGNPGMNGWMDQSINQSNQSISQSVSQSLYPSNYSPYRKLCQIKFVMTKLCVIYLFLAYLAKFDLTTCKLLARCGQKWHLPNTFKCTEFCPSPLSTRSSWDGQYGRADVSSTLCLYFIHLVQTVP